MRTGVLLAWLHSRPAEVQTTHPTSSAGHVVVENRSWQLAGQASAECRTLSGVGPFPAVLYRYLDVPIHSQFDIVEGKP
jgi:hypothetical protein